MNREPNPYRLERKINSLCIIPILLVFAIAMGLIGAPPAATLGGIVILLVAWLAMLTMASDAHE